MPAVVCVLRSGGEYLPEHVVHLYEGVRRWWPEGLPLRFVVLADMLVEHPGIEVRPLWHNWSGWWAKMELFDAMQDDLGDVLAFDLDTVIVGPLTRIVAQAAELTMLTDFYHPTRVQSGFMALPMHWRPMACAAWKENPREWMQRYRGDGEFLDAVWRARACRWQTVLPGQVRSYKKDVRGREMPAGTRVLCFHGQPRPWTTEYW